MKREKLEKISNIEHFKETALRWKNCSYEYKRVHALVDWEKGGKMAHKACKGTFFKESFLISKEKEAATVASLSNNTDENTTTDDTTSIHSILKSPRKLTQYKSSLDDRNCIICNGIKYEKGRKVSLLSMTLRKHGNENHRAEETLTKFENIRIQNDTKYKDAARRILLQENVTTLFAANVSYHKDYCFDGILRSFHKPKFKLYIVFNTNLLSLQ